MHRRSLFLAATSLLLLPANLLAHADTLDVVFQLNGAYAGSGTFSLNTSPGQTLYTASTGLGAITGTLAGAGFLGMDNTVSWANGALVGMTGYAYEVGTGGGANGFNLGILNFAGTLFEADYEAPNAPGSLSPTNHFASEEGTITAAALASSPTAITPEPSAFVLLGTGLLGSGLLRSLAGLRRRRA